MEDRVSLYPGRVRLTPVSGQSNVYDLERWDSPTEPGTPLNKANLLSDAVAEFLGLDDTAVPNDAFQQLRKTQKAQLCFESIETSGNWTVPSDLYGDKIFVICVGGGGSGGTHSSTSGSDNLGGAGGSGHLAFGNISVTPGQTLTAVIGAGGTSVSGKSLNGKSGGTTTFGGLSAAGGGYGYSAYSGSPTYAKGGDGGAGGAGGYGGSGGNGSFGGGGGSYSGTAGNGGTYGGGGGCATNGTPGNGGTYGGVGGHNVNGGTGTFPGVGASYKGSLEMWNLAATYYGVDGFSNKIALDTRKSPLPTSASATGAGGGGLGSIGGGMSTTVSALGNGGGGFLACGGSASTSGQSGGGGLFGYNNSTLSSFKGGGGFYAAGDSVTRGSGGKGALGSTSVSSTAGGNGVVAIWYFVYKQGYLNENIG